MLRPYLAGVALIAILIINFRSLRAVHYWMLVVILGISGVLLASMANIWSVQDLRNFFCTLNEYSIQHGNTPIDLFKTNYFERFIYLMFGPFVFSMDSKFTIVAYSTENLILAAWFGWFFWLFYKKAAVLSLNKNLVNIIFSILLWLVTSTFIYNYGLASRYKVLLVPFLFIGVIFTAYENKNN